jgi:hypothetical protein
MITFLLGLGFAAAFALMASFVLPANWDISVDDEGEAVADSVVTWWHRYRNYRKVVSDEYSRHDGTQVTRNPRRYLSPVNDAPPAYPAEAVNRWFGVPVAEQQGRHLTLVGA